MKKFHWLAAASGALVLSSLSALSADYYVATTGNNDNSGQSDVLPFATIDKAISVATSADDVIHVAPGTYTTSTQYGPNLKAKLVGEGASRDEVVIQSSGANRTLRTAAGSMVTNVTIVGVSDISKADKGGAIEMSGGTVVDCVIRDGTAYGNKDYNAGGNIYSSSTASLVVDCVISGGTAKNRGGNVCFDQGTLRRCTISGGSTSGGTQNRGGNVWIYQGSLEDCVLTGGSADLGGSVYLHNSVGSITGGSMSGGTATQSGGNLYLLAGSISRATLSGGATTSNNNSQGGGNVYAEGSSTMSNCVLENGTAKNRGGNAFLLAATIENSTVTGGSIVDNASGIGGNVFMNNASALVSGCTVSGGTVPARGGNVFLLAGTVQDSTVENGVCTNPTDQYWGGANLFVQGGKVSRCVVRGGSITGGQNRGGGLSLQGDPAKTIEDTLVYGNANGGIYSAGKNLEIWNCTVVDNAEFGFFRYGGSLANFANCVLFANRRSSDSALANWSGNVVASEFQKLASDDAARFASLSGFVLIDSTAFADYANADYRPAPGSALVDVGATDSRSGASATDLAKAPRTSGPVDIGCYEYQKSEMTVSFAYAAPLPHTYAPVTASFTLSAQNVPAGQTVTYTVDFGDGSDPVVTTDTALTRTFDVPGHYTVTVRASATGADDAEMTYENFVSLTAQTVYVTAGNAGAAFPYDTPETGYATVQDAFADAVDDTLILVGAGVYPFAGQLDVSKAVTIRGLGASPEDVVFRNTQETADTWRYRVLQVNNAAARVENVTLENGRVVNQYGGNLRVAAGIVSNCVIRGGTATANNGNAAGGGFVLGGQGGIVTHCVVSNNLVSGTSNDKNYAGGAVFIEYGVKDGRLSNLLIAYNGYISSDPAKAGTAGVRYGGGNDRTALESCTIVTNTVTGELPNGSAGLYCTSWHVPVRDCIIVGNYETAKRRCTSAMLDFSSGSGFSYLNNITDDVLIGDSGTKSKDNILVDSASSVFRNYDAGDFHLNPSGPAFGHGTTGIALLPAVDLDGNPRVLFDKIDIGCYECPAQPCTLFLVR